MSHHNIIQSVSSVHGRPLLNSLCMSGNSLSAGLSQLEKLGWFDARIEYIYNCLLS